MIAAVLIERSSLETSSDFQKKTLSVSVEHWGRGQFCCCRHGSCDGIAQEKGSRMAFGIRLYYHLSFLSGVALLIFVGAKGSCKHTLPGSAP